MFGAAVCLRDTAPLPASAVYLPANSLVPAPLTRFSPQNPAKSFRAYSYRKSVRNSHRMIFLRNIGLKPACFHILAKNAGVVGVAHQLPFDLRPAPSRSGKHRVALCRRAQIAPQKIASLRAAAASLFHHYQPLANNILFPLLQFFAAAFSSTLIESIFSRLFAKNTRGGLLIQAGNLPSAATPNPVAANSIWGASRLSSIMLSLSPVRQEQ